MSSSSFRCSLKRPSFPFKSTIFSIFWFRIISSFSTYLSIMLPGWSTSVSKAISRRTTSMVSSICMRCAVMSCSSSSKIVSIRSSCLLISSSSSYSKSPLMGTALTLLMPCGGSNVGGVGGRTRFNLTSLNGDRSRAPPAIAPSGWCARSTAAWYAGLLPGVTPPGARSALSLRSSFTRSAYLSVLRVCSTLTLVGEMFAIMTVRA
mmetsp:Transcript_7094/g.19066  ORF Transcript_7094/g.19066 Transcript_7094/m.19066 type:complete len:206 (+) Transcript_7094:306-923(+)